MVRSTETVKTTEEQKLVQQKHPLYKRFKEWQDTYFSDPNHPMRDEYDIWMAFMWGTVAAAGAIVAIINEG
jgi:hypothetical protein